MISSLDPGTDMDMMNAIEIDHGNHGNSNSQDELNEGLGLDGGMMPGENGSHGGYGDLTASSMSLLKCDNQVIKHCLFTPVSPDTNKFFRCKCCGETIAKSKSSFWNLKQHFQAKGKHNISEVNRILSEYNSLWAKKNEESKLAQQLSSFLGYYPIHPIILDIFNWVELICFKNIPITWCDDEMVLKYLKPKQVSSQTVTDYMDKISLILKENIKQKTILTDKFGLVLDGWSDGNGTYWVGLFAVPLTDGHHIFLGLIPLPDEVNNSDQSFSGFLSEILYNFNRTAEDILFILGENSVTYVSIANMLKIPFLTCSVQKLNLSIKQELLTRSDFVLMDKINHLISKILYNNVNLSKLRMHTMTEPIRLNKTDWSSILNGLTKYVHCADYITTLMSELEEVTEDDFLTTHEMMMVNDIIEKLQFAQQSVQFLQQDGPEENNMLSIRQLFDKLLQRYPTMINLTSSSSPIFENAVMKILDGKSKSLTVEEVHSVQNLIRPKLFMDDLRSESNDINIDVIQEVRLDNKKRKLQDKKIDYYDLRYIPTFCNLFERTYQKTNIAFTMVRQNWKVDSSEVTLFLAMNQKHWNIDTVRQVYQSMHH